MAKGKRSSEIEINTKLGRFYGLSEAEIEGTNAALARAEAWWSLAEAKAGDRTELTNRIRLRMELSPEEAAFAADLIEGKVKRTRGHPASFALDSFWFQVVLYVVCAEMKDLDAIARAVVRVSKHPGEKFQSALRTAITEIRPARNAVKAAADHFDIDDRRIFEALSKHRENAERFRDELLQIPGGLAFVALHFRLKNQH
jgi:hypothetical protein